MKQNDVHENSRAVLFIQRCGTLTGRNFLKSLSPVLLVVRHYSVRSIRITKLDISEKDNSDG